jgi:hypothetical protein
MLETWVYPIHCGNKGASPLLSDVNLTLTLEVYWPLFSSYFDIYTQIGNSDKTDTVLVICKVAYTSHGFPVFQSVDEPYQLRHR